ncbi:hypothetical protein CAEBREN_03409 [Caenorhabditis brenneri]|uniref:Uncharacterized protein n=1 Tax=Caenorhabditis brenneri TaxID=135651 RepID=G0NGI2_CAEBE|nr:hypothetical protein CAEBREN_03409 [Caenorhabditis brenneri]
MKKLESELQKYKYVLRQAEKSGPILFSGSFALSDTLVGKQRAHKLEFHTIPSAKYATQIIILSVKWERRIGEIQKRIEPIAENSPSTPGTIPQSAPLPALAQVLNPMNVHAPTRQPQKKHHQLLMEYICNKFCFF